MLGNYKKVAIIDSTQEISAPQNREIEGIVNYNLAFTPKRIIIIFGGSGSMPTANGAVDSKFHTPESDGCFTINFRVSIKNISKNNATLKLWSNIAQRFNVKQIIAIE